MTKYTIEGNINFYEELFKSLDDDSDNEETDSLCQITGTELIENFVTLECKHKFNYNALYTEISRQKLVFKTYDITSMSKNDKQKVRESKLDYFIRCPYCRNLQFTILPYYAELGLQKRYGINSLDQDAIGRPTTTKTSEFTGTGNTNNYTYTWNGILFSKSNGCSKTGCPCIYTSPIPNTLSYCKQHYRSAIKSYNASVKQNALNEKKKLKEDILLERKKLFDEKNAERVAKGLPLLKRLPQISTKPNNENTVLPAEPIGQYVAEGNDDKLVSGQISEQTGCKSVLKYGANKGKLCACKVVNESDYCLRHNKITK
jgi:hypothetical protein